MKLMYKALEESKYQNVKEVLKVEFSISDRLLLKLKKMQRIYLNGENVYVHNSVNVGDTIVCDLDYEEDNSNIVPTPISLSIIYEDDCYLVIDKPAGIPIHPSMDHFTDSLSNGVRYYFDTIGLKKKIRPVNRLDKDTSGLVIFAKNEYVQECLIKQMQSKKFVKKYIAIVEGHLDKKEGTICAPISRKENSIIERCVSENGEKAITHYKVINQKQILEMLKGNDNVEAVSNIKSTTSNGLSQFEVVECTLETGRTHQIRVHFSYLGHPLVGDTLYGSPSSFINRQALHCYFMSFVHPVTGELVCYKSDVPNDMYFIIA